MHPATSPLCTLPAQVRTLLSYPSRQRTTSEACAIHVQEYQEIKGTSTADSMGTSSSSVVHRSSEETQACVLVVAPSYSRHYHGDDTIYLCRPVGTCRRRDPFLEALKTVALSSPALRPNDHPSKAAYHLPSMAHVRSSPSIHLRLCTAYHSLPDDRTSLVAVEAVARRQSDQSQGQPSF